VGVAHSKVVLYLIGDMPKKWKKPLMLCGKEYAESKSRYVRYRTDYFAWKAIINTCIRPFFSSLKILGRSGPSANSNLA
jgi:hypothetical protein